MATAEMTFSTLQHFKTYLHNKTSEVRLTRLVILSIQKEINVNPNEVVRRFALTPRKQGFVLLNFFFILSNI